MVSAIDITWKLSTYWQLLMMHCYKCKPVVWAHSTVNHTNTFCHHLYLKGIWFSNLWWVLSNLNTDWKRFRFNAASNKNKLWIPHLCKPKLDQALGICMLLLGYQAINNNKSKPCWLCCHRKGLIFASFRQQGQLHWMLRKITTNSSLSCQDSDNLHKVVTVLNSQPRTIWGQCFKPLAAWAQNCNQAASKGLYPRLAQRSWVPFRKSEYFSVNEDFKEAQSQLNYLKSLAWIFHFHCL